MAGAILIACTGSLVVLALYLLWTSE